MAKKKFVFIITHSFDRPDLAAGAFQLAANMKAFDAELDFFLMDNGVLLAKEGFAETLIWQKNDEFSPVHQLMKTLIDDFDTKPLSLLQLETLPTMDSVGRPILVGHKVSGSVSGGLVELAASSLDEFDKAISSDSEMTSH